MLLSAPYPRKICCLICRSSPGSWIVPKLQAEEGIWIAQNLEWLANGITCLLAILQQSSSLLQVLCTNAQINATEFGKEEISTKYFWVVCSGFGARINQNFVFCLDWAPLFFLFQLMNCSLPPIPPTRNNQDSQHNHIDLNKEWMFCDFWIRLILPLREIYSAPCVLYIIW